MKSNIKKILKTYSKTRSSFFISLQRKVDGCFAVQERWSRNQSTAQDQHPISNL